LQRQNNITTHLDERKKEKVTVEGGERALTSLLDKGKGEDKKPAVRSPPSKGGGERVWRGDRCERSRIGKRRVRRRELFWTSERN